MIEFRLEWNVQREEMDGKKMIIKEVNRVPTLNIIGRKELFISEEITHDTDNFHLNSLIESKPLTNKQTYDFINGI